MMSEMPCSPLGKKQYRRRQSCCAARVWKSSDDNSTAHIATTDSLTLVCNGDSADMHHPLTWHVKFYFAHHRIFLANIFQFFTLVSILGTM